MAVGDVVNGVGTVLSSWIYFIPASGVECVITGCAGTNLGLSNGVNLGSKSVGTGFSFNEKICINNTNYLAYYGTGDEPMFTGIQIK